jgi:hypothetical protein
MAGRRDLNRQPPIPPKTSPRVRSFSRNSSESWPPENLLTIDSPSFIAQMRGFHSIQVLLWVRPLDLKAIAVRIRCKAHRLKSPLAKYAFLQAMHWGGVEAFHAAISRDSQKIEA